MTDDELLERIADVLDRVDSVPDHTIQSGCAVFTARPTITSLTGSPVPVSEALPPVPPAEPAVATGGTGVHTPAAPVAARRLLGPPEPPNTSRGGPPKTGAAGLLRSCVRLLAKAVAVLLLGVAVVVVGYGLGIVLALTGLMVGVG